jgi:hypothetical protein
MLRIFGGLSVLIYLTVIVLVIGLGEGCNRIGSYGSEEILDTVALSKHWEKAIPNQTVPEGMRNIRAEECGLCHTEIYKEWKQSIHSIALQDPQFQAEFKKDNVYVCLNCHTPLQNQQEFIVTGLINGDHKIPVKTPNPEFDPILKQESITCATCHVRNGSVIGAKGHPGSPHPVVVDPLFLSEQICLGCHNVTDVLNPALVCTFETGDEWMETSKKEQGFNCISCHMPTVKRAVSEFGKEYDSHKHHFPGSGIPKFADMKIEGLQGLEIIEDKIKLNYQSEDTLIYELIIRNSYAGHSLPSGDPERFYLIDFKLVNSQGVVVDDDQFRIGEEWQWYPRAKKISDNNIKSGEQREFHFKSGLEGTGRFNLVVEITKYRITKENAEYNQLPENFPRYISIFNKTYPLLVDPQ